MLVFPALMLLANGHLHKLLPVPGIGFTGEPSLHFVAVTGTVDVVRHKIGILIALTQAELETPGLEASGPFDIEAVLAAPIAVVNIITVHLA